MERERVEQESSSLSPARKNKKNIADLEQRHLSMFADVVRFQELL